MSSIPPLICMAMLIATVITLQTTAPQNHIIYLAAPDGVTKVKPVDVPDVQLIPWFNIVFLIVFAAVFWAVWVRWVRFRRAKIDPTTERISDWFADKWDRMRGRG